LPDEKPANLDAQMRQGRGVAFLVSQVGALSSREWNRAVAEIGIDSRSAMLLWNVGLAEGRSQRELANELHLPGSRMVEMVDALEAKGWLERRMRPGDRRTRELHLTAQGKAAVDRIMSVGADHEQHFAEGLDSEERQALIDLLTKVAAARGLISTVHPDF
jgi:DNA-binding MarR family transcriptional regulator